MSKTVEQDTGAAIPAAPPARIPAEMSQEELAAREMARRYRLRFVDLKTEEPAYNLIHELPVEMMVRHSFVSRSPRKRPWKRL